MHLHQWRNKGMRYMGVIAVESETPGKATLRVRVIAERNTEKRETTNSAKAKWEPVDDDIERAEVLLAHVLSQLRVPLSEAFRRRLLRWPEAWKIQRRQGACADSGRAFSEGGGGVFASCAWSTVCCSAST